MKLFAVIAESEEGLESAIERIYPGRFFHFGSGQWLIYSKGTARQVAAKLKIQGGTKGRAVVLNVAGYFGYHKASLWEWIAAEGEVAESEEEVAE